MANKDSIYLNNKYTGSTITSGTGSEGYGTWYLTQHPAEYEIQRSNNFMFYVDFSDGFFSDDADLKLLNQAALKDANDVLRISVSSAFVPHFSTQPISIKRGNNTMKFAGVPEFKSGTLKLDDFIGAGTKDILMAWQRKVYNPITEKVGLAKDYKRTAYLIELTPDYQVVRSWKLFGCWISGLEEGDFDHESNERHQITASIEYDKAVIDTTDIPKLTD